MKEMLFTFPSRFFYAVLSGVCFALSVTIPMCWWLVFAGLAFFLAAVSHCGDIKSAVWIGWLIGIIKVAAATSWVWYAFPFSWISIDSQLAQALLLGFFQFSLSIISGAGLILPAVFFHRFRQNIWTLAVAWPFVWVAGEVAASFLASALLLGPGSSFNAFISYGYAGLPLSMSAALLPAAAIAGLYSLTYAAALSGAAIFLFLKKDRAALAAISILIVMILAGSVIQNVRSEPVIGGKVAAIDTFFLANTPEIQPGSKFRTQEVTKAVTEAMKLDPAIVLLPEDARLTDPTLSESGMLERLHGLEPDSQALIVDSARTDIGNDSVALRAYYYDLAADRVYLSDKQFLAPIGEYITYLFRFILDISDDSELIATFGRDRSYLPGPYDGFSHFPRLVPTMLFCFESVSPLSAVLVGRQTDSDVILHPLSHDWFREPRMLWYQLDMMLRTQAVWSNKIIITAGNMSPSHAYYPDGRIEEGRESERTEYWRVAEYGE